MGRCAGGDHASGAHDANWNFLYEEKLVNSRPRPPTWESVFLEEGYIDPQEGYKYPFEYKIHKVITAMGT